MIRRTVPAVFVVALVCLLWANMAFAGRAAQRDMLFQVSTIDALLDGVYDGTTTIKTLLAHGDTGLGTFDALEGEMVVMDGVVYQALVDGTVKVIPPATTTPFAAVTPFEPDFTVSLANVTSMKDLMARITEALPNANLFYAIRATGRFTTMKTRSVPRQSKPYPPLAEVVKTQTVFDFSDVDGDIVGLYSPAFVKGVGVPGFHLHFLNSMRDGGGHMLDCSAEYVEVRLDTTPNFLLALPQTAAFGASDLTKDREHELKKVEQ